VILSGADDEGRSRNLLGGNQVLCQLSYIRLELPIQIYLLEPLVKKEIPDVPQFHGLQLCCKPHVCLVLFLHR
jgi:hypothetical protein